MGLGERMAKHNGRLQSGPCVYQKENISDFLDF